MPKNAHLHIVVSTEFLENLKKKASEKLLTVSEFCRLKLQENLQLDRIEEKIDKLKDDKK
ncbi:MAG: hypothetical protein KC516_02445 [Nanoarchaeota archaeon]|nr:hypothetical protein [Nanoarchaeota archaeon]